MRFVSFYKYCWKIEKRKLVKSLWWRRKRIFLTYSQGKLPWEQYWCEKGNLKNVQMLPLKKMQKDQKIELFWRKKIKKSFLHFLESFAYSFFLMFNKVLSKMFKVLSQKFPFSVQSMTYKNNKIGTLAF